MTRRTPDSNTMRAASGSVWMLNSVTAPVFPTPRQPPISTTSTMSRSTTVGKSVSSSATLVSAAVATNRTRCWRRRNAERMRSNISTAATPGTAAA